MPRGGPVLASINKYTQESGPMDQQNITVKNVSIDTVELLREIRLNERRQLAAILEDCVREYWNIVYGDEQ